MPSLKIISCKGVIEMIRIEVDQFKILAMMVTVTFDTRIPLNLN